ncbi:carboxypeptidase B-like [Ptychodera flava]|uniref:carboxypeptidase B-like n=1 Tax=Ptychodera flava TaxID=63121 RepID=UPI00396A0ECA
MSKLAVLLLVSLSLTAAKVRYDGYEVLRIDVESDLQLKVMDKLNTADEFDFWNFPRDLMVSPEQAPEVKYLLEEHGIPYKVWIPDVQAKIDSMSTSQASAGFYNSYKTYDEIAQWVKEKATTYSSIAQDFVFSESSYEGRELRALKISGGTGTDKPVIWIEGGIHAREWISPATVMFITDELLADYSKDGEVKDLLDTYDLYVHPLMNPDGYEYTRSDVRMWRKTRAINVNSTCIGVDGNRNFEYEWGGNGSSSNPCSGSYRGEAPNSEPEVRVVTDYLKNLKSSGRDIALFLDFHSYGQIWLTPYSFTGNFVPPEPDYTEQMTMADAACAATFNMHGKEYTYGPCGVILYEAAGNANDFGYGTVGAVYSFVVELRDNGEHGFLLPEDQIIPTGEETYAGVRAAFRYLMNKP